MLVITNLAIIITFATPYWSVHLFGLRNDGLWAQCHDEDCEWAFSNDFALERLFPAWFKAVQGLMSVGLGLSLVALLIATLSLCCTCHSCNPHQPVCGLLLLSCITMAVGIIVFGIKASEEWEIGLEKKLNNKGKFGWSFWVGVAAVAMAFLTSFIYCCIGRKQH